MSSLVSILIPAYNSDSMVGDAIRSALAQTHPAVEVIVVDDGSTDGTLRAARKYEGDRVRVIKQENAGACVARNRALAEARGEYVKFLDADDVLAPDAVETQLWHLARHQGSGRMVSFGGLVHTDADLVPLPSSRRTPPPQVGSASLAERVEALLAYNIQTSLPLHRRKWLEEVGGFRAHLKQGQEYDLHLRLALAGVQFHYLEHVVVQVRRHGSPLRLTNSSWLLSEPENHLRSLVERRQMIETQLGTPLPPPILKIIGEGMWGSTRRLARDGQTQAAIHYAAETAKLDPGMKTAGRTFRTLGRLCGPVRAERTLMKGRQLLGRT